MPPEDRKIKHYGTRLGVDRNGNPLVQLVLNERIIAQMSPAFARDYARAIIEAAEKCGVTDDAA